MLKSGNEPTVDELRTNERLAIVWKRESSKSVRFQDKKAMEVIGGREATAEEMDNSVFCTRYAMQVKKLAKDEERRRREEEELRAKEAKQLAKEERRRRREEEELRAKEAKQLANEERRRRREEEKQYTKKFKTDVRDVAEQPLIFRRADKWTSKYEGVSKKGNNWRARITINKRLYDIGCVKTEKEAAQLFAKANKKYIEDRNELTGRAVDVRDVAEQPLIFRRADKWTSKYEGVSKSGDSWLARITINKRLYDIGYAKTEEEAAQLYAKANKKYIEDGKPLSLRPEYQKKSAPAKVRRLPSSNELDLYEPATKKQKIEETVVVASVNSSFVDLSSDDWEDVYQIATKTTDMLAKG
eukprot:scaffold113399_cov35-Cyclotella_meneghiniana.AAC.2